MPSSSYYSNDRDRPGNNCIDCGDRSRVVQLHPVYGDSVSKFSQEVALVLETTGMHTDTEI